MPGMKDGPSAAREFFAHSADRREHWEPLAVHLGAVAERAGSFAEAFHAADEARLAGLLHDLGKYSELFTERLEGRRRGLDHWSLGAWAALNHARKGKGIAAALAIQGHHIGLQGADLVSLRRLEPSWLRDHHPLGLQLTSDDLSVLLHRLEGDGLTLPQLEGSMMDPKAPPVARMLDVRMLYSTLVDGDFLETEAHFQGAAHGGERRYRPRAIDLAAGEALEALLCRVEELARGSSAAEGVDRLRGDVFRACLEAGGEPPGLFTLSAPTGSGKTLAMLAFALRQALDHGLRRVVLAVPYVTIADQTAKTYRSLVEPLFGDRYLLEHHSLAGLGAEPAPGVEADSVRPDHRAARLLAENWDAPLVLTTNVQLLESLFSNRPSTCRKLHRLASSAILFDEAQTLPRALAVPTLGALAHLSRRYGASIVFATATQPAFDHLDSAVRTVAGTGWRPREIAPSTLQTFERSRRVAVTWRLDEPLPWQGLAEELVAESRVLCILNLKRHAALVAQTIKEMGVDDVFHLSTNLCPAHRDKVLEQVRRRLSNPGGICRLVATQCVEAGVDLDFPAVYRAFAPLDALTQAAGRCNRNGNLAQLGRVTVFLPEEEQYPPGGYEQAAQVTRSLFRQHGAEAMDLSDTELFRAYCRHLYDLAGVTGGGMRQELQQALASLSFPEVARFYRLIDQDAIDVLVPYDLKVWRELRTELEAVGHLTGDWARRSRRHAVSLFRPRRDDPIWAFLEPVPLVRGNAHRTGANGNWWIYLQPKDYCKLLGLRTPSRFLIG